MRLFLSLGVGADYSQGIRDTYGSCPNHSILAHELEPCTAGSIARCRWQEGANKGEQYWRRGSLTDADATQDSRDALFAIWKPG
jgi:hypothetical protein